MSGKSVTYRDAGVDIDEGDALVERIKPHAQRTARPEVLAGIGGFGGLFQVPKGYQEPVLVASTGTTTRRTSLLESFQIFLTGRSSALDGCAPPIAA